MTIVELLAALALLTSLSVVSLAWTLTAQHSLVETSARTTWRRAAAQALALVHDDLVAADIIRDRPPTCRVVDGQLHLDTRLPGTGPAAVVYRLDAGTRALTRAVGTFSRTLLGACSVFELELLEPDDRPPLLRVRVEHANGDAIERTFPLLPRRPA